MKTIEFNLMLGLNPGYNHKNEKDSLKEAIEAWKSCAEEEFSFTTIYVSAVIVSSRTVYRKEWGCPDDGEVTVLISGLLNKDFYEEFSWKESVRKIAKNIQRLLEQRTVYLTFKEIEFEYLQ